MLPLANSPDASARFKLGPVIVPLTTFWSVHLIVVLWVVERDESSGAKVTILGWSSDSSTVTVIVKSCSQWPARSLGG